MSLDVSWEDQLEALHALDIIDKKYVLNEETAVAPGTTTGTFTLLGFSNDEMRIVKRLSFYGGVGVVFSFIEEPQYAGGGAGADGRFQNFGFTLKPITEALDVRWTLDGAGPSAVQVITTYFAVKGKDWDTQTHKLFSCLKEAIA